MVEIIKLIHALSVQKEKEANIAMFIVNGLMDNVFQNVKLAVEIIKQIHAMSVHKGKELNGVMVIVNGLMDNAFQDVRTK